MRSLVCAALLLLACVTTAQAKSPDPSFYDATLAEAALPPGTLLKAERMPLPPLYRAKAWRMLYATRDTFGRPIVSSGMAIISTVPQRQPGPRKIVAWAHPTTGTKRACAPSLAKTPHKTIVGIDEFVSLGYAVVATDYPGLGTPGPTGYLVGKGQAYATLDAIRAMQQIANHGTGKDVVLFGYSQGGHAAIFASLLASRYAPGYTIRGVAAIAPPTDLRRLLLANIGSVEGRVLAGFTLQSWAVKYGLSMRDVASENSLAAILAINKQCIDTVDGQIGVLKAQKKLGKSFLLYDPGTVKGWNTALRDNSLTSLPVDMPALVIQGDSDDIVRPNVTLDTVRASCRAGTRVKFISLPGRGHTTAPQFGVADAVQWISERFAGLPAPSNCR
ncbi:alpha/beta fold hydrolase [Aestuariivirga sp.]|uniref:alpha/beta fold hydrolase n=1 Tax=Aestuariivirga sp. TaxID=2650926 RepID=UPI0039E262EE